MKKIILFAFTFVIGLSQAQIFEKYPDGQDYYKGGRKEFYKQFHNLLIKKNLKPCENKDELYSLEVVVYPDSTIKFVKQDSAKFVDTKCAYELTRIVLKDMKDWSPAIIEGKNYPTLAKIAIYPDDLFENYVDSYLPEMYYKMAEYEGGINAFRKKVANNIDVSRFRPKNYTNFKLEVTFVINKEGQIEDAKLVKKTDNSEFNEMVLDAIKSIKKKWKPATMHDKPVKFNFRLPLTFNF